MKLKNKLIKVVMFFSWILISLSCSESGTNQVSQAKLGGQTSDVFPHKLPDKKPNIQMSSATERMYTYLAPRVQGNELFSQFKYTPLRGFDYNQEDGTISRRDPSRPIKVDGKYYMWYTKRHIAEDPLGPFTKHPLNPVLNSGHETTYFLFKEGVAALAIKDGNERETMQYSSDGVNFEIASSLSLTPIAAAPFATDLFTDTDYGRGFTWGLCHFINAGTAKKRYSIMARFDCDPSLDFDDPKFKKTSVWHKPEVYFAQGMGSRKKASQKK